MPGYRGYTPLSKLGVQNVGDKNINFDSNTDNSRALLPAAAYNYSRAKQLDETVHPILYTGVLLFTCSDVYAIAAVKYTVKQTDELNACWNSLFSLLSLLYIA
jgi:hypothetical protein